MTVTYEVTLIGGPIDGTVYTLDRLPHSYYVPEMPTIAAWNYTAQPTKPDLPHTHQYELAITYGAPSRDDAGRYRYQYRGAR